MQLGLKFALVEVRFVVVTAILLQVKDNKDIYFSQIFILRL